MNKILIRCDSKDFILRTNRTALDICKLLDCNKRNILLPINKVTLVEEDFKDDVIVKPAKVTLIKDITEDEPITSLDNNEWITKLANEISSIIKEQQEVNFNINDETIKKILKGINDIQKNKNGRIIVAI